MFFEAQRRFENRGISSGTSAYVRDLLTQYGDAGRRINLPERSQAAYNTALQHRMKEKAHFQHLESQVARLTQDLQAERTRSLRYAKFISQLQIPSAESDAPHPGNRGGDTGGDSGGGALPPADRPGQDDTDAREPEAIISSPSTYHEPPNASSARSRRNRSQQQLEDRDDARIAELPAAEAGGAHTDPADGADADVGGPAAEHDPAE